MAGAQEEALFPGALAPFQDRLCWTEDDPGPALTGVTLRDVLGRFQRSSGGAWQPSCSFWAQHTFNTVLVPAICWLAAETAETGHATAMTVACCPQTGCPLRCVVRTSGPGCRADDRGGALADCLARHLDALIMDLATLGRLSARMLRESALLTVAWTLGEIGRGDAARARTASCRLARHGLCPRAQRAGIEPVRRFCCLRYHLPGVACCGDTCPRNGTAPRETDERSEHPLRGSDDPSSGALAPPSPARGEGRYCRRWR